MQRRSGERSIPEAGLAERQPARRDRETQRGWPIGSTNRQRRHIPARQVSKAIRIAQISTIRTLKNPKIEYIYTIHCVNDLAHYLPRIPNPPTIYLTGGVNSGRSFRLCVDRAPCRENRRRRVESFRSGGPAEKPGFLSRPNCRCRIFPKKEDSEAGLLS